MKTASVRHLQQRVRACVDASQAGHVVVTRRGRPAAVLIGVEGLDWEAVAMATSRTFWRLIAGRRREAEVPLDEVRRRFAARREARGRSARGVGSRRHGKGR